MHVLITLPNLVTEGENFMSDDVRTPLPGEEKLINAETNGKPLDKEIHDLISETIGPLWEKMNIDTAIVIARVPNSDRVSIYYRGHFFDVATLLSKMNSKFTAQVDKELGR
jgi:hypothetical protein